MGELDLLKPTIERSLGGTIHFGRVSMKPGKPTTFATVPVKNNKGDVENKLIFSLPGNPASAITCLNLFVRPCLAKASGVHWGQDTSLWKKFGAPRVQVVLAENVRGDKAREEYQRATVSVGENAKLYVTVTGGQRSSRVASFKDANALLVLPAGHGMFEKGTLVEALLIESLA
jgi:gephyrin